MEVSCGESLCRTNNGHVHKPLLTEAYQDSGSDVLLDRRMGGDIINRSTLNFVIGRKVFYFPISVILRNVRPFGHQVV